MAKANGSAAARRASLALNRLRHKALTKQQRSAIARKAANARWAKRRAAKAESVRRGRQIIADIVKDAGPGGGLDIYDIYPGRAPVLRHKVSPTVDSDSDPIT